MTDLDLDLWHRPSWHRQALCRGGPVAPYFPERGESGQAYRAALMETCERCPVDVECLTAGIREQAGTWAGTSPKERQTLRRKGAVVRRDGTEFSYDKTTGVVERLDDPQRDDLAG